MTSTLIDRINGLNEGVAMKANCRIYSTVNLPLSSLDPVNGKTPIAGERILVAAQTDATQNGVYFADVGAWSRSPDFDGARDIVCGTIVQTFDPADGPNLGSLWRVTTPDPIVVGSSVITFAKVGIPGQTRGPFPSRNIFMSEDGLLLATPDLPAIGNANDLIAIGNGAMASTITGNSSIAMGTFAGQHFGVDINPNDGRPGRSSVFLGYAAGRYVNSVSSWTVTGAFAAEGFETDPATGLDASGTHPNIGHDVCAYGEACLLHIIGNTSNVNAYGFNAGFGLKYASSNNLFGVASGYALVGVDGDIATECQNSFYGHVSGQYGRGKQGVAVGAAAAGGKSYTAINTVATNVGDFVITLDDVTNFTVGTKIYQGGTIPMDCTVTARSASSGPGTVTIDKAVFNAIPTGFTWISVPNQHTGQGITAVGFNALGDISGASNYCIGIGYSAGSGLTTGNDDILIGRSTGTSLTTGGGNLCVGALADVSGPTVSNTMNIMQAIYGTALNSPTTGNIGIKVVNPATTLDVGGSFSINSNIVVDTNRIVQLRSYTVATLPAAGTAGRAVFASNARVFNGAGTLEGAGVGTGGLVTDNGTAWKIAGTNITVSA